MNYEPLEEFSSLSDNEKIDWMNRNYDFLQENYNSETGECDISCSSIQIDY